MNKGNVRVLAREFKMLLVTNLMILITDGDLHTDELNDRFYKLRYSDM